METLQTIGWIIVILLFGLGTWIRLAQYTYRFCTYALWLLAGCIAVCLLLHMLKQYTLLCLFIAVLALVALAALVTGIQIIKAAKAAGICTPCDYLIVLGCTVDGDRPSRMLQYRIDTAYAYLTKHPHTRCIVTGGLVDSKVLTEARCMYRALVAMGIDPHRLLLEEQATSTIENFTRSMALLQAEKPGSIAVISSEFHLYRVEKMAKNLGLTIHTVSAETKKKTLFFNNFIREIPAVWFYKITGG